MVADGTNSVAKEIACDASMAAPRVGLLPVDRARPVLVVDIDWAIDEVTAPARRSAAV